MPDSYDNDPTLKEWCSGTLNLIFDNGDIDACTITGLDTQHVPFGAAATTPTREYEEPILTRSTKVRKTEKLGPL